jgi:hypothetical protein
MKLSHLTILFVIIAMVMVMLMDIKTEDYQTIVQEKVSIDQAFRTAVDDAAIVLLEMDANRGLVLNKDNAKEGFFTSLYSSLGILVAKDKQELIQAYVPVIAVTGEDGYYIYYSDEFIAGDGFTYYSKRWSEKFPYYYEDSDFIYGFTLSDTLTIYDKNKILDPLGEKVVHYIDYHEVQTSDRYSKFRIKCSNNFMLDDETFLLKKKEVIITEIEKSMKYYVSSHNKIARNYGITYNFALPIIDNSDYVRSIDNPSVIAIFQGYPYGTSPEYTCNRVAMAGAKITKNDVYYLEQISWYYIYHLDNCEKLQETTYLIDLNHPYYREEDCIQMGAYACEICINGGVNVPNYKLNYTP